MLGLFTNQSFWLATWGLLQTLLLFALPGVPRDVIVGFNAVVAALLVSDLIEGDIRGLVSRRVLMAAIGYVAVIAGWLGLATELWVAIEGFAVALINIFAIRDATDPDSMRNVTPGTA